MNRWLLKRGQAPPTEDKHAKKKTEPQKYRQIRDPIPIGNSTTSVSSRYFY